MLIYAMRFLPHILGFAMPAMVLVFSSCISDKLDKETSGNKEALFPDFITPNSDYYDTRIDGIPEIDGASYELKVSGAIDNPRSFSLEDLGKQEMVKKTLTIECIGNSANGSLMGTAEWRGFRVYDLLESLGIQEGASTVKYISADGYFTYNTLDELQEREVLGTLYMNDASIPPLYGFPLRIIFPGYYGVRQPGWVVEMEVLKTGPEDFWSGSGWKTNTPMTVDSKIFFPGNNDSFYPGDSIRVGGAAFGARRISSVDVTLDNGLTWIPATITRSLDQDYVWVFWELMITPQESGTITISSRATSADGAVQPEVDTDHLDGTNSWPEVNIKVLNGS
jgi:hypothetical protein